MINYFHTKHLSAFCYSLKDHGTFIEAAARLAIERPDVHFVCVGGGPDARASELRDQANRRGLGGRLRWIGERPDIQRVYPALDLLVSSSTAEGFSNVIGEAMACGVPCVVTDVGDSARIVGQTGVVVPPRDSTALTQGMTLALSSASSGQVPRSRVVEQFALGRAVAAYERLAFQMVAGGESATRTRSASE